MKREAFTSVSVILFGIFINGVIPTNIPENANFTTKNAGANGVTDFKIKTKGSERKEPGIGDDIDERTFILDSSEVEKGKLSSVVKRTILYPGSDLELSGRGGPFCYDRYVTGNCRYRTDPEYCFQYEWTAYAIVQNLGGGVRSEPPGLFVEPGTQERVRVWVKTSCCTPFIKILSISPYNTELNACVLDVRELQGLHPGEIAGIVIGVLILLIIIIAAIVLLIRKRNSGVATVEDDCQVKSYGYNSRPGTTPSHSLHTSRPK